MRMTAHCFQLHQNLMYSGPTGSYITVFKMIIWAGVLSDLQSEIKFNLDTSAEQ